MFKKFILPGILAVIVGFALAAATDFMGLQAALLK